MITSIIRNPTEEEIKENVQRLPGKYKRFEDFMLKFIFIAAVLLVPLLIYDRFYPVAPYIQAIYSIVMVVLAIIIVLWIIKKYEGGISLKKKISEFNTFQLEVVKVKTQRAVKREDPEDFGIAFYIDVTENGQRKTLYLWGPYLDDLEYENRFPNTDFEFLRNVGSDEFIDFKTTGQYFEPEKVLPPFKEEIWNKGNYPVNGQLLNQTLDSIIQ